MISQDLQHLKFYLQITNRRIEKIHQSFHSSKKHTSKHTIFLDNVDNFDPVNFFDTTKKFISTPKFRPKAYDVINGNIILTKNVDAKAIDTINKSNLKSRKTLKK